MIEPSVGRVVWYRETTDERTQPMAALVVFVHDNRKVNLTVFNHQGWPSAKTEVPLLQESDEAPWHSQYAEWMPFQKGQAAKMEQGPLVTLPLKIMDPQEPQRLPARNVDDWAAAQQLAEPQPGVDQPPVT